jgi:hypothetical protein
VQALQFPGHIAQYLTEVKVPGKVNVKYPAEHFVASHLVLSASQVSQSAGQAVHFVPSVSVKNLVLHFSHLSAATVHFEQSATVQALHAFVVEAESN